MAQEKPWVQVDLVLEVREDYRQPKESGMMSGPWYLLDFCFAFVSQSQLTGLHCDPAICSEALAE